jgi:hypothetical protein
MAPFVVATLVSIGGIFLNIWLDKFNLPQPLVAALWIIPFASAALIAWWGRWKAAYTAFSNPKLALPGIEFYRNRNALNKGRGGIGDELLTTPAAWAIWPAGHHVANLSTEQRKRLRKMLLGSPVTDEGTARYAHGAEAGTPQHVSEVIRYATTLGMRDSVDVRWHHERMTSVVVGNPDNPNDGWVRVELCLPHLPSTERPSLVISGKIYPDVVRSVVDAVKKFAEDDQLVVKPSASDEKQTAQIKQQVVSQSAGREVIDKLATLLYEAEMLERECIADRASDAYQAKALDFYNKVAVFLQEQLGTSYAVQFKTQRRTTGLVPIGFPANKGGVLHSIQGRKDYLNKLIDELRARP